MEIRAAIAKVVRGEHLSGDEIAAVMADIMAGRASPAQIGGLLIGLRCKGETADELAGAARAMRAHATPFACPEPGTAVDTCGTGGDGSGSVNISTMAAVVAAAAGVRVVKHGNRSLSSKCGSADVLEALGVNIAAPVAVAERCLRETGITFLFAPAYHAATKHAAGPRRELGTRTIFNLLGPLTNPGGVKNQVVGVFASQWVVPVAQALGSLGARSVFVVHGHGGLDEFAIDGPTEVARWHEAGQRVEVSTVTPEDFGLAMADPAGLCGGGPEENARIFRALLDGMAGPVRTAVLMAAAASIVAGGLAEGLADATELAIQAIDKGKARGLLDRWITVSQG